MRGTNRVFGLGVIDSIAGRRAGIALCTMLCVALLSACASAPKVRVDKDANTDFTAYNTFAWFGQDGKEAAQVDSLSSQRIRGAIKDSLLAKGYTLTDTAPDFRVSFAVQVYERPKESGMRLGVGAGGGGGNVGGGVGLSIPVGKRTENVIALTVDIVDAARNAQVWTASHQQVLTGKDMTDVDAQKLVDAILEKYPSK